MTRGEGSSRTLRTIRMDMGMLGVPVIDGDLIEPRAEILLHLTDQLAGESP